MTMYLPGIQIQQLNMTFGDPLSPPVAAAMDEVVAALEEVCENGVENLAMMRTSSGSFFVRCFCYKSMLQCRKNRLFTGYL
ncbi:MAG: hypothetical protein K8R77_09755 [Anaerolineaceae bacterium]|nr:hypothetical protein [Anaerolineaceae bacterium]